MEWDPSRLGASPAVFDLDRLSSHSTPGTSGASPAEEPPALEPFLDEPLPQGRELQVVEAIREDMRLLSDAPRLVCDPRSGRPRRLRRGAAESSDEVFARAAGALEDSPAG